MEDSITLKVELSSKFFAQPFIEKSIQGIWDNYGNKLLNRVMMMNHFLRENGASFEFTCEDVKPVFMLYYRKALAQKGMLNTLEGKSNFNFARNLCNLINKDFFLECVYGAPLVDAYIDLIQSLPRSNQMEMVYRSHFCCVLRERFAHAKVA